ncbi:hypothetical protein, partial [Microbacterium lacticum]|uniref:hypothetical protein n=1 Tax=Microbacterium lacticum TaxID=33885 RepID=UPI001C3F6C2E
HASDRVADGSADTLPPPEVTAESSLLSFPHGMESGNRLGFRRSETPIEALRRALASAHSFYKCGQKAGKNAFWEV